MPDISLRAYGKEIDELVEGERLEEAIAHCRYILQTYPKHLVTYRHLGKAYLEAKRFGDAADIFQRVLSAVPDDFVSHVGMGIVREDEGNLDAAIWHMERAFETNPSNPAIQQEMKRLISRRDGLEPHKVRLTRGALARMYAHGELYAQAIAELRSALQEDAERPDLQVLLASMYWQTDQRSDATSVSNQILEKLPYCAEANRILAANLQVSDRVEEAAVYHRRLANLDPYAAFVKSALADAISVEDSAVTLERLDWVAGEALPSAAPGQPGWATTLGMEMQEGAGDDLPESAEPAQTGPLPSWLEPGEPPPFEAAAEKELGEEMQSQAADGSGDLPEAEFLDDLGTETADADVFGEPELESEPEPEEGDSERRGFGFAAAAAGIAAGVLASGDDEDSKATADSETELDTESEAGVIGAAGVAAGALASGTEQETEATADSEAEMTPTGEAAVAAGMFDQVEKSDTFESESDLGLADDDIGASEVDPSGDDGASVEDRDLVANGSKPDGAPESEIPDWMQEAGWGESKGEFEDAPVSFSDQELKSLDAGEIPAEVPEDDGGELAPAELPDWIHDIAPDEVQGGSDGVGDESLPGWIGAEAPSEDEPISDAAPPTAETELTGQDAETEASFPAAKSDTSELPAWIISEQPGATETIVTWLEDRGPDSPEDDAITSEDLPDWMRDTGPLDDSADSGLVDAPDEIGPPAELPMKEAAEADHETAAAEFPVEEAVEAGQDVTPSTELPIEEPIGELPGEQASDTPSSESWLSAVAAVAAEEESSPSSPEEKADRTPDWLSDAMETPEDSESGGAEHGLGLAAAAAAGMIAGKDDDEAEASDKQDVQSFAEEIETADAEIDGEIAAADQEIEKRASPFKDQPEPSATSSAPDWLEEIGTLPDQPMQTDSADWLEGLEIDGEDTPAEPAPETPDWLKGLAEEGADTDESGAAPAADWLREIGEPGSVSEEEAVEEAEVSTQDEYAEQPEEETAGGAPDWLQATRSDEDEEATPEADLVSEAVEFEPDTPAVPAEEDDDEVMDWLQDLATKQAEAPAEDELKSAAQVEPTAPVLEDRDIPDEPEEGLEWLEQLADQRGLDVDVSVPGQAAPASGAAEPEPESDDTAPGWLERMATQPIPKVDMEALEAAARSEGIDPQAETINAQAADIQAQPDELAVEREAEEAGSEGSMEVEPDDITIEARATDLQAEIEQEQELVKPTAAPTEQEQELVEPTAAPTESAQDLVEPTAAPADVEPEDEIPDWLIAAAEQADPPSDATSGLPAEFVEDVEEHEPETEPAATDKQKFPAESAEPSEPKTEEEVADEIQFAESIDEEVEVDWLKTVEPAQLDTADKVETPEVAELVDRVALEEAEPSDVAEPAESAAGEQDIAEPAESAGTEIDEPADMDTGAAELTEPTSEEPPSPELQKKEDLLERSRHALASGDTRSATELYGDLVKRKESLESVIEDLRIAVDRTPDNADLWQLLGDAYMRDDQTDEAIDAYRKGMEAA